jgi:hypothetical protein
MLLPFVEGVPSIGLTTFKKADAGMGEVTIGRAPLGLPQLVMRAVF